MLSKIRQGNPEPLYKLYKLYRNEFIRWAVNNFSCSEDEAKDVFQETIIRFYNNVMSGKLTALSSDLKTYLWSIARFQLLNLIKSKERMVTFSSLDLINVSEPTDTSMNEAEEEKHNKILVQQHLSTLDEKSRQLIALYYLEEKDMKTIATTLGYKNADVAKKKKYEVMKKLAAVLNSKLKMLFLI